MPPPVFQLPNAVVGRVVTRFPPEPSWHLDIGHCKAALMNQAIAAQFQGCWILRFDDTNPCACSAACVDSYLKDMPLLGLQPDRVSSASDYFGAMIAAASQLITSGLLYADDTPIEEMRQQRLHKQSSSSRDRPMADSLAAWQEMQAGSEAGRRFCLRFRLQPQSENGAMRDPVAFRVILQPHYKTGTAFKVYPTYDFGAPFLDLAEGVTHALRTLEFRDRDELYRLVQQAILQHNPQWQPTTIWEFPRIHMAYTPQAKSQQKALLAAGLLDGPHDPRLPTLRGLMRAGCRPDALRAFLLEQVTPARKETFHLWDKLWTLNRRLLDPEAARHMAVNDSGRVLLTVVDGPEQPQPAEVQWKGRHHVRVVRYKQVWIDQEDAQVLAAGDEIVLLAWGNATITSLTRQQQQQDAAAGAASTGDAACFLSAAAPGSSKQQQQQQWEPAPAAAAGGLGEQRQQQQLAEGFSSALVLQDQPPLTHQHPADVTNGDSRCCTGTSAGHQQQPDAPPPLSAAASGPERCTVAVAADGALPAHEQRQKDNPDSTGSCCPSPVVSMTAVLHPAGDPKAAVLKVHWLPALPELLLPLRLVRFSHPIRVERVTGEVDVLSEFRHDSRRESLAWGDPSLLQSAAPGAVVQLQRKGFFIIDDVILTSHSDVSLDAGGGGGGGVNTDGGVTNDSGPSHEAAAGAVGCNCGPLEAGGRRLQEGGLAAGVAAGALGPGNVRELVMFAIPDGHTKHDDEAEAH